MKESVIKVAYEHAIKHGVDDVSLVKISNDLGISRRSVYRLFKDKYELLFEVYKMIIAELLSETQELNKTNLEKDGYHQALKAIENMVTVFLSNQKKVRFITKFDGLPISNTEILERRCEFYKKCDFTQSYLVKGLEDGSISNNLDSGTTSCIIVETFIGMVSRLHDLDKREYVGCMKESYVYELVDVFACYLKC